MKTLAGHKHSKGVEPALSHSCMLLLLSTPPRHAAGATHALTLLNNPQLAWLDACCCECCAVELGRHPHLCRRMHMTQTVMTGHSCCCIAATLHSWSVHTLALPPACKFMSLASSIALQCSTRCNGRLAVSYLKGFAGFSRGSKAASASCFPQQSWPNVNVSAPSKSAASRATPNSTHIVRPTR